MEYEKPNTNTYYLPLPRVPYASMGFFVLYANRHDGGFTWFDLQCMASPTPVMFERIFQGWREFNELDAILDGPRQVVMPCAWAVRFLAN